MTGASVVRDMFYDGNPQAEPGAVVVPGSHPSFVRFGTSRYWRLMKKLQCLNVSRIT
jgi:hypothetical protein